MIAVVLLASPLGGAAVTGVVLRWHEIQQSRSAVTSAIATTSLPSAGETQNDIEPPENDFGTTHH